MREVWSEVKDYGRDHLQAVWMQGKSLDPSLLKFIGINLGVMLVCYVTICLVAMVLLLMPAKGRPGDN
jgi:hypothetical protein